MSNPAPIKGGAPAVVRGRRSLWPVAAVVITIILCMAAVAVLTLKVLSKLADASGHVLDAPARIVASVAGAFQPNITVTTLLSSTIGEMHSHPKLVVLTTQIDAEVNKASNTTWAGINFGTTTVRVLALHNKVQYYVPLQGLETSNFIYDDEHKKLIVRVPQPMLDEEIVDVQSDPAQIDVETSNGWAKLDTFSGAVLRDEAKHDLRTAVLAAGRSELLEHEAERRGQEVLKNTLRPITDALKPGVDLDVEFLPGQ